MKWPQVRGLKRWIIPGLFFLALFKTVPQSEIMKPMNFQEELDAAGKHGRKNWEKKENTIKIVIAKMCWLCERKELPAEQHRLGAAAFCKLAFVLRTDVYKPEEDEVQRVFKLHIKNEPGELIFTDGERAGMPKDTKADYYLPIIFIRLRIPHGKIWTKFSSEWESLKRRKVNRCENAHPPNLDGFTDALHKPAGILTPRHFGRAFGQKKVTIWWNFSRFLYKKKIFF